ncbi:YdcF family protein [Pseudonocardia sp. HH130630-07]|uniref:YdcF family protein n=1 Tax=Pseudonocardia sp. HH130630-07 TaxID=1690815 RepID=UPI000814F62B|nr:YdcF family protein [Pseudonocardia sp. HH130630-07]ANY05146.1 hypothetical protein AFB00_01090 [Pseudonocardia sp. HH130630-07]
MSFPALSVAALVLLLVVAPLVLTVVGIVLVLRRVRREPRRLSNAYWLLGAALLLGNVVAAPGVAGANPVFGLIALVTVTSPLLALVFAVFLILNGIVMLRRERASLGNSLSLLAGLLVVVLLVAAVPVLVAGPIWLKALWLVCALGAYVLAFQFVAFLGYAKLYARLVRDRPAGWVVVLGSGLHGSTVPPLLASRIRTGLAEFRRRDARMLVLSGGKGSDEHLAEGEAMRRWALEHGADPATARAETASRNTEENLRFTDALVRAEGGPGPGLMVTSNYHAFRAAMLARRLGIDAQAVGAPTAGYYWPSAVLREFVAILREHRVANAVLLAVVAVPLPAALVAFA